jgi:hypothetical protein
MFEKPITGEKSETENCCDVVFVVLCRFRCSMGGAVQQRPSGGCELRR